MQLYRFSPIQNEEELLTAITHTHLACFQLCKNSFSKYFPIAGNIGIFCHYPEEYKTLTQIREKLTSPEDNVNQKYFKLYEPIVIPETGDVPETTYTHLYIRQPDPYRAQVGDVDFIIDENEYIALKQSLIDQTSNIPDARVFPRADLDMVELYNPTIDALAYISPKEMTEKARIKQN